MWFVFALGSAVFAALTSILAKVGIEDVNSNLATAVRTLVVLAMAWGMVFLWKKAGGLFPQRERAERIFEFCEIQKYIPAAALRAWPGGPHTCAA